MDGIEASPASAQAAKAQKASADATKNVKLTIAICGLLIGGALIAWNLGVFGGSQPGSQEVDVNVPAEVAGRTGPQIVKPQDVPPPQPNKPKSNINFH